MSYTSRDANGRALGVTLPGSRTVAYSYDANGNLTSLTTPNSNVHAFTPNQEDLLGVYAPPAAGISSPNTTYAYDLDSLPISLATPSGPLSTYYDTAGRVALIANNYGTATYSYDCNGTCKGHVWKIATGDGTTLTYGYNGMLLTSLGVTGPWTHTINKTYDSYFKLNSWQIDTGTVYSFGYDADRVVNAVGALTITRSAQNGLLTATSVGGESEAYTYNSFGELTGQTATYGSTIFSASYTPPAWNSGLSAVTAAKSETIGGVTTSYSYVYDPSGRLYQVSINGSLASTYSYDADGNRLSLNSTSATYDTQDRMLTYGSNAYTYDDNGELASITVCPGTPSPTCSGGSTTNYIYDILGNLREVTPPSPGSVIDYMIDGKNRRIGKKVAGTLVQGFLYDEGQRVLAELDSSGAVLSQFVYGTKPITPDYMVKGGTTYRIVSDMLGSVRLVVNASTGAIAQEMDYDEFGNVVHDTSPGFQPFGFAGGIYDRDVGFVRFGARDYDPLSGRWHTKDVTRFNGGFNLYSYANDDPANEADPDGLSPCCDSWNPTGDCTICWKDWGSIPPPPAPDDNGDFTCDEPRDLAMSCTTKCDKVNPDGTGAGRCTGHQSGRGSGKTRHACCVAAQKDANRQAGKDGCRVRHCDCDVE